MINLKKQIYWDNQYVSGKWDLLNSPLEFERFEAIRKVITKFSISKLNILELGCGEGLLEANLSKNCYSRYVGVDISPAAITKARAKNANVEYYVEDMETFIPDTYFDIIVFNESIYYAVSPIDLLNKYSKLLKQDGLLILSIFETVANSNLLVNINDNFNLNSLSVTRNSRGQWFCCSYSF